MMLHTVPVAAGPLLTRGFFMKDEFLTDRERMLFKLLVTSARFGEKCTGVSAEIRVQNNTRQSVIFVTTFAFDNHSHSIASPVIMPAHNEEELAEHNKFVNVVLQAIYSNHGPVFGRFCSDCKQPMLTQSYRPMRFGLCDRCLGVKSSSTKTVVYLVQSELTGLLKIGITQNLKKRVRSLETGQGGPIHIVGVIPGDATIERDLHERFADDRRAGEWFNANPQIFDTFHNLETLHRTPSIFAV